MQLAPGHLGLRTVAPDKSFCAAASLVKMSLSQSSQKMRSSLFKPEACFSLSLS